MSRENVCSKGGQRPFPGVGLLVLSKEIVQVDLMYYTNDGAARRG